MCFTMSEAFLPLTYLLGARRGLGFKRAARNAQFQRKPVPEVIYYLKVRESYIFDI